MYIDEITQKFIDSPGYLKNGAGFLAQQWKCTRDQIYEAKEKARKLMEAMDSLEKFELKKTTVQMGKDEFINEVDIFNTKAPVYTGSESTEEGSIKKFESPNALTPEEIEKLAGVDNINTYVARVWDKLLPSGKWIYSIDIRYRVKDFYTKDELKRRLEELMPSIAPVPRPRNAAVRTSEKALIICLADDHVGAINVTNLFNNRDYNYKERLEVIFQDIMNLEERFEEVHIISLGDQMNGWSSQTTRGGHEVKSKSNKEQFDEYLEARLEFYDNLFTSGIGDNYFVHDVENSNHSGLGMSYMANKALQLYLDGRYENVIQESVTDMIGGFQYGKHIVIFGHGKDEKFQVRPMPAVLNDKTDLYLYDYIQNKGYSPYKESVTFYKGDLHQLGYQHGKFGRYVNVQSIAGNSDYGDANFGNTKGGALLEMLHKDSYKITSQPIWF
jgi:hypothetical protein